MYLKGSILSIPIGFKLNIQSNVHHATILIIITTAIIIISCICIGIEGGGYLYWSTKLR